VRTGFVIGRATPKHLGKTTQVWEIIVSAEDGKPVCLSRLTVQVLDIQKEALR
jgi:1,4-dihydroxy-2-naphthoyl-CoA hydrolase